MSPPPHIAILGVGQLATHLVEGLFRADVPPPVTLSPHGRAHVEALAARFPVTVAPNNRNLAEGCDVLVVSVPPWQAGGAPRAARSAAPGRRPGLLTGRVEDCFFDPLPEEELDA